MGLRSKVETITWFLKRPNLFPQLIYLFYQRFIPHKRENTRAAATAWCNERSITSSKVIKDLTGNDTYQSLRTLFPDFFTQAKKRIQELPVKMGGEADLELLYYLTEYCQAKTVVETGVAYGWSSSALLFSLQNRIGSVLYSTDMPYPKMNNEEFVGCLVPEEVRQIWKLIQLPDRQAFKKIAKEVDSIDLCHYDSDKSYRGRMWAYAWLWKRLRIGGLFISDDINDNEAFKDFAEEKNEKPIVVYYKPENKYVGLLIKSK